MIITWQGQKYDITNWDEFSEKLLNAIGFQVESEIIKQINQDRIVDTGMFKRSINFNAKNQELTIGSSAPYSAYLEYGTAGKRKGIVDQFGESSRGPNPGRKMPVTKKSGQWELVEPLQAWAKRHGFKDKPSQWLLAKYIQEHGMEPRAPFRKVLYNQNKMAQLINKAVKVATR